MRELIGGPGRAHKGRRQPGPVINLVTKSLLEWPSITHSTSLHVTRMTEFPLKKNHLVTPRYSPSGAADLTLATERGPSS